MIRLILVAVCILGFAFGLTFFAVLGVPLAAGEFGYAGYACLGGVAALILFCAWQGFDALRPQP